MASGRSGSLMLVIITVIVISFPSVVMAGPPVTYEEIKSLNSRWYYFDEDIQKFIPYIPGLKTVENTLVLPVGRSEFPGTRISISLPGNSDIFIGGKYIGSAAMKIEKRFDLDSMFRIFSTDTLLFTVRLQNKNAGDLSAVILLEANRIESKQNAGILLNIRRGTSAFNEFIIVGLLIGIGFISFLMRNDFKRFGHYMNIARVFGRPETDDLLERGRPLAGNDLLFVILEAVLLGFFFYLILYTGKSDYSAEGFNLFKGIVNWLVISLAVLSWSILKFSLESYLARIMQVRDIIKIHFFESNRISIFSLIACTFLSLIILYGFKVDIHYYHLILLEALVVIAFARFILIAIKILNYSSYKKMYIISYLCTSELLPVIIGLKIILDSSLSQLL